MGLIGRAGEQRPSPLLDAEARDDVGEAGPLSSRAELELCADAPAQTHARDRFEGVKAAANKVGDAFDRSCRSVTRTLDRIDDAVLGTIQRPMNAVDALEAAAKRTCSLLHVDDRIAELSPGDTYRLYASVDGAVAGVGGRVKGIQEITRSTDGTYKLVVQGEAGAGMLKRVRVYGIRGQTSAFLNGGAKMEFKFATADEAAQAARSFMGPTAGAISGWMEDGARGVIADATFNTKALRKNLKAVELTGSVSAEIAAQLGLRGQLGAGFLASLGGIAQSAVRLQFQDGAPNQMVLRQHVIPEGVVTGHVANAKTSHLTVCAVEIAHRFDLPDGLASFDLGRRPDQAIKQLAENARATGDLTVSIDAETQGVLAANPAYLNTSTSHGGMETSVTFNGRTADILDCGGLQAALCGNLEEALTRLSPVVKTTVLATPTLTQELGLSWGIGNGLHSYALDVRGQTVARQDPIVEGDGDLQDARRLIEDLIENARSPDFQIG